MKRLLSVCFFLLLISPEGIAQSLTRMQSWGLDLESVAWITGQEGISVGEKLIIRTSDAGTTWEEVLQKFEVRFSDVVYLEDGKAVAVGEKGTIYLSLDGGKSWQQKVSGTQNNLLSIARSSDRYLTAVGEKGELINSRDAGETWAKVSGGTSLNLNDITFVNDTIGFIAADGGKVLKSTDKGNTWTLSGSGQNSPLYGIAFPNEMIGYAVGEKGLFIKTLDGGATWAVLNSTTTRTLRKVAFSQLDVRIVAAVGDSATVIRTANSGTSFTKPNLGATNTRNLKGISLKPRTNLASAVGQNGYLINSTNGGSSWAQKFAGIRNNFTGIDFKNLNTGFIAGERGSLYVTSNGAATLTHRPLPEPILIQTIDFWNTSFGYTGSAGGKIYRTSNAGSAWVPVFTPANRVISGYYLFATSVVYLAGSQGHISRSFDSGVTWDQTIVSNTTENLRDLMFFDYQFGFAIGEKGQLSWSDGGSVWEPLPKLTEEDLNALAKIDTTRAFVVGDGGVILKTDDKARTWKKIESGTTKNLNSVDFFGENNGFIAGEEGLVLVTSDGGATWKPFASGTIRNLSAVNAGTDQKAYFAGDDGTILAYICAAPVGSLGEITGDSQSCLASTTYSITELPQAGSDIEWRVDGGEIISGQGTNQIEIKWTVPGRNAVLVSRSNFCGNGETSAMEVNVAAIPPAGIAIGGDGAVCQESSYNYSLPNIEGVNYTWVVTGGEIKQGQGTHAVEIKWNQSGAQLITVSQENYCGPAEPIRKEIAVSSTPVSPGEIDGESKVGLWEQGYEIEGIAGLNYRWSVSGEGGKITSGQGTDRIMVLWEKEGDFELSVEAQNECGFSPQQILPVNVNIITALEPRNEGNLKIYPNPSEGNLTVSSHALYSWSSAVVLNPMGQVLETLSISPGQTEIHFAGLPKGLLLIRLEGKDGVLTRKILVR